MAEETDDDNLIYQLEEIEALSSIYGDDFRPLSTDKKVFEIQIQVEEDTWWTVTIQVRFPCTYPSKEAPHFKLFSECLSEDAKDKIRQSLINKWKENFGQGIVYTWIESMREQLLQQHNEAKSSTIGQANPGVVDWDGQEFDRQVSKTTPENVLSFAETEDSLNSLKQVHFSLKEASRDSDDTYEDNFVGKCIPKHVDEEIEIISGEPVTDRKSTFQAHSAHVVSEGQVKRVLSRLKENRKVAVATHNILAYRIVGNNSDSFLQDSDDDGETNAGGRLLHLLQILDARNVMVVVSRWYGGILLGPDRFKHINNCARTLLHEVGFTNRGEDKFAKAGKDKKSGNKKHQKLKKR